MFLVPSVLYFCVLVLFFSTHFDTPNAFANIGDAQRLGWVKEKNMDDRKSTHLKKPSRHSHPSEEGKHTHTYIFSNYV